MHLRDWSLLAAVMALGCGGEGAGADASRGDFDASWMPDVGETFDARETSDVPGGDARGTAALAVLADGVMTPVIDVAPTDLSQCVGAVVVIVTATDSLVQGYGATTRGGSVVPDGRTLFQIGSLTKVFTGLGLARLVAEGALAPTVSVGSLLDADLSSAATSWPSMQALITHHSGLDVFPANLVDRDGDGRRDVGLDPRSPAAGYSREHLGQALGGYVAPMDAPYLYSNFGLGLAGLALEDHLDLPGYHATLRRLVTDDLGMSETWGEVDAIDAAALPRLAPGQSVERTTRGPGIPGRKGVLAGAGEVVMTGDDMALLLGAMIGARTTPLDAAIALATTPLASGPMDRDMGYAIEIEHRAEGDVLRKGGNTSSYSAYVLWSRSPAVGVAVMTSCGSFMVVVELAEQLHDGTRALAR